MQRLSFSLVLALVLGVSATANANTLNRYRVDSVTNFPNSVLVAAKAKGGSFVGVDHPTQGRVNIVEENGVKYLEISEDFKTDRGPDLKVILHNSSTVNAKVAEGDYLNLGKLKSFNGAQRYQLPQDLDLADYQSVAIWCEQFNVTFGYATIK